jgi:hypothetical protein
LGVLRVFRRRPGHHHRGQSEGINRLTCPQKMNAPEIYRSGALPTHLTGVLVAAGEGRPAMPHATAERAPQAPRLLGLVGIDDATAAIETVRRDVVPAMHLTRARVGGDCLGGQEIVRAMHAALGRGLAILLDGHGL